MLQLFSRLLLITALLLGQQAALTHSLAHARNDIAGNLNPDNPLTAPDHCDKCASFSHLQAVLHSQPSAAAVVLNHSEVTSVNHHEHTLTVSAVYLARGPPHFI